MNYESRRKFIFSLLVVPVILVVLVVHVLTPSVVSAQVSAQATESSKIDPDLIGVDYELSYPGLLPDHPLYFIKAGRDRLVSFFTSNPLKKAEFDLLQADKRVKSAQLLVAKDKIDLAQSTFSKAENYYEDGINNLVQAKSQGVPVEGQVRNFRLANLKHQQVFYDTIQKLNTKDRSKFATEEKRLIEFGKKVKQIDPK